MRLALEDGVLILPLGQKRSTVGALLQHFCDVDVLVQGLVLQGELRDLFHKIVYFRDRCVFVVTERRVPFSDVDGLLLQIGPEGLDRQVADLRKDGIVVVQHHRHLVARRRTRCTRRRCRSSSSGCLGPRLRGHLHTHCILLLGRAQHCSIQAHPALLNAHSVVDQPLVGERCHQGRDQVHLTVQNDKQIDFTTRAILVRDFLLLFGLVRCCLYFDSLYVPRTTAIKAVGYLGGVQRALLLLQ
mmetsp:Transcript_40753/g.70521  ORF Transcript_40753/g.70521 Transcript_40753/m.70521 type:complete len:243 (+) Transcript_40753:946-1674(+)